MLLEENLLDKFKGKLKVQTVLHSPPTTQQLPTHKMQSVCISRNETETIVQWRKAPDDNFKL